MAIISPLAAVVIVVDTGPVVVSHDAMCWWSVIVDCPGSGFDWNGVNWRRRQVEKRDFRPTRLDSTTTECRSDCGHTCHLQHINFHKTNFRSLIGKTLPISASIILHNGIDCQVVVKLHRSGLYMVSRLDLCNPVQNLRKILPYAKLLFTRHPGVIIS